MKYFSMFSGVGGFERGIELAWSALNAENAKKSTKDGETVKTAKLPTQESGEPRIENAPTSTQETADGNAGSESWRHTVVSVSAVEKLPLSSSQSTISITTGQKKEEKLGEEESTTRLSHWDSQTNTNFSATTVTLQKDSTENAPICVGYSEIDRYAIKVYERHFGKYESCNEHAHLSEKSEQEERTQGGEWSIDKHEIQLHARNRTTPLCNRCKGHRNYGNATLIQPNELPDFELLVGGFPCQAFSIAGKRKGFDDTRGTLFFDIARILENKRPRHLVLENVKGLLSHDSGKTFQTILGVLSDLGYGVEWQILNSKDFGVPQNRERIFFIGHLRGECGRKVFPITGESNKYTTLGKSTETTVARTLTGGGHSGGNHSGMTILQINQPTHSNDRVYATDGISPTLNTMQGGNRQPFISQEPRIRRLTPKECERLQGFPDDWTAGESDTQRYKMCGNAVTVNVIEAIMANLVKCLYE